jgi:hypothetical protein
MSTERQQQQPVEAATAAAEPACPDAPAGAANGSSAALAGCMAPPAPQWAVTFFGNEEMLVRMHARRISAC